MKYNMPVKDKNKIRNIFNVNNGYLFCEAKLGKTKYSWIVDCIQYWHEKIPTNKTWKIGLYTTNFPIKKKIIFTEIKYGKI